MHATGEKPKIFIIIPAFNEAMVIDKVISGLRKNGYYNILVVDDGSQDETSSVALSAGAEVINQIINRGQGAALRTGIEYAKENYNPDIIITFDADGQHDAKNISAIMQPLMENSADIVLGSRFLNKTNMPILRKIILKAGVIFTNIISDIRLTDTHNGFRALGRQAIRKIKIYHRGMEHASDIIDQIIKNKLRYAEVPVNIIYTDYSLKKGQRSSNFIKIGFKILLKKILK